MAQFYLIPMECDSIDILISTAGSHMNLNVLEIMESFDRVPLILADTDGLSLA